MTAAPAQRLYLRRMDIVERLGLSKATLLRLRKHPDPAVRFPKPTMILNNVPLWAIETIEAYERAQQELSKTRKTVGPQFEGYD